MTSRSGQELDCSACSGGSSFKLLLPAYYLDRIVAFYHLFSYMTLCGGTNIATRYRLDDCALAETDVRVRYTAHPGRTALGGLNRLMKAVSCLSLFRI